MANQKKPAHASGSQKVVYTERREDGSLYPLLTQKLGHWRMEQKDDAKYPLLVQRPGYWNMELIGDIDRILLQVGIKPENKRYMAHVTITWDEVHALMNTLKLLSKCPDIQQMEYQLDKHRFKLIHPAMPANYDQRIKRWLQVWSPGKDEDHIHTYRNMAIFDDEALMFVLPFHVIREMMPYAKGMYRYYH